MSELSPLGKLVEAKAVKPSDFADRVGVSRGHGHDLLTGRRTPGPTLALKIEEEFGFPADELNPAVAAVRAAALHTGEAA